MTITYRTRRKETYIFRIDSRKGLWQILNDMACNKELAFNHWDAGRVLKEFNQRNQLIEAGVAHRFKLGGIA